MSNNRMRESRDQILESERPKRVPLREQLRNLLTVANRDPGYHYRIVNDTEDRVARFKMAGYELAPENIGFGDTNKNDSLGTGSRISVGGGITGVLMRIRKEYYEEDQKAEQDDIDDMEREMLRNKNRTDGLEGELTVSTRKSSLRGRKRS